MGITLVTFVGGLPIGNWSAMTDVSNLINPYAYAVNSTVTVGSLLGSHGSDPFYAVFFAPEGIGVRTGVALGAYLNSTPFTWFRLSEGGEAYDATTSTSWVAPAGGGAYQPLAGQVLNFSWFKIWCNSRTPHCNWIGTLPAEENSTSYAVHTAKWFHQAIGFPPTAWQFGNEPNAWTHYGKNVTSWSTTDNHAPTGWDYATMVKNYIKAISALYPADRFIGLEANCACGKSQIPTTAQVDGSKIMGMAYHEYPWLTNSGTSVSQFMNALNSSTGIPTFASKMRTLDATNCTCANLPIQIGEYQAGIFNNHSPLAHTYDGAPFIVASVIQALASNISMFTEYALGDLYNSSTGAVLPEGMAYQRILANFTMGQDYAVTVSAPGVSGIYAIETVNGTHESLLIVNANTTSAIRFILSTSAFPVGSPGTQYRWSPIAPAPRVISGPISKWFLMQPLSILLLTV